LDGAVAALTGFADVGGHIIWSLLAAVGAIWTPFLLV